MSITPGTRFGPYQIGEQLGAGGMGEVYRARDTRLDRNVAIKVVPKHLSDIAELRERSNARNRNSQELFFLSPAGAVMRVGVERAATWSATVPTMLIKEGYFTVPGGNPGRTYDVSTDGQRFLLVKAGAGPDQTAAPTSIIVVQHWANELKRLVPTR